MKNLTCSFLFLFLFSSLFSCAKKIDLNKEFRKEYGPLVEQINDGRDRGVYDDEKNNKNLKEYKRSRFLPYSNEEIEAASDNSLPYSHFDLSQIGRSLGDIKIANGEFYWYKTEADIAAEDLFYKEDYPLSYKTRTGFDNLIIPEADAYGIKSALPRKNYLLVGSDSIQKAIDKHYDKEAQKMILKIKDSKTQPDFLELQKLSEGSEDSQEEDEASDED